VDHAGIRPLHPPTAELPHKALELQEKIEAFGRESGAQE
jgi:hypothetical protein